MSDQSRVLRDAIAERDELADFARRLGTELDVAVAERDEARRGWPESWNVELIAAQKRAEAAEADRDRAREALRAALDLIVIDIDGDGETVAVPVELWEPVWTAGRAALKDETT